MHTVAISKSKIKLLQFILKNYMNKMETKDISQIGRMLINGRLSETLYDCILQMDQLASKDSILLKESFLKQIGVLVNSYTFEEISDEIKKQIFITNKLYGVPMVYLLWLWVFVYDFYYRGLPMAIEQPKNKVVELDTGFNLTLFEMILYYYTQGYKDTQMSKREIEKIDLYFERSGALGFLKSFENSASESLKADKRFVTNVSLFITQQLIMKSLANFTSAMMCPDKEYGFSNKLFSNIIMDTEEPASINECILNYIKQDILMDRKFYVRDKGIIIRFSDKVDFEKIYMREVHNQPIGTHYIFARFYLNDGVVTREISYNIDNIKTSEIFNIHEIDSVGYAYILYVLGLMDDLIASVGVDNTKDEELPKILIDYLNKFKSKLDEVEITYEEPEWWNYDKKAYQSSTKKESSDRRKLITIGSYTRKLPYGYKASETAELNAAMHHINLKKGYTFVESFDRSIIID